MKYLSHLKNIENATDHHSIELAVVFFLERHPLRPASAAGTIDEVSREIERRMRDHLENGEENRNEFSPSRRANSSFSGFSSRGEDEEDDDFEGTAVIIFSTAGNKILSYLKRVLLTGSSSESESPEDDLHIASVLTPLLTWALVAHEVGKRQIQSLLRQLKRRKHGGAARHQFFVPEMSDESFKQNLDEVFDALVAYLRRRRLSPSSSSLLQPNQNNANRKSIEEVNDLHLFLVDALVALSTTSSSSSTVPPLKYPKERIPVVTAAGVPPLPSRSSSGEENAEDIRVSPTPSFMEVSVERFIANSRRDPNPKVAWFTHETCEGMVATREEIACVVVLRAMACQFGMPAVSSSSPAPADEARLLARALGVFDFENRITPSSQTYEAEVINAVSDGAQSLIYLACLHYLNDREECDLVMECFRAVSHTWPALLTRANDETVRIFLHTGLTLARDVRITESSTEGCARSVCTLSREVLRGGFRGATRVSPEWRRVALDSALSLGLEAGEGGIATRRRRWSFDPWKEMLETGIGVVGEYDVLVDDFEKGGDEVFAAFLPTVCVAMGSTEEATRDAAGNFLVETGSYLMPKERSVVQRMGEILLVMDRVGSEVWGEGSGTDLVSTFFPKTFQGLHLPSLPEDDEEIVVGESAMISAPFEIKAELNWFRHSASVRQLRRVEGLVQKRLRDRFPTMSRTDALLETTSSAKAAWKFLDDLNRTCELLTSLHEVRRARKEGTVPVLRCVRDCAGFFLGFDNARGVRFSVISLLEATTDLKRLGLVWEEANATVMACDAVALFARTLQNGNASLEEVGGPEIEKFRSWFRSGLKRAANLYLRAGAGEEYDRICGVLRERPEVAIPPACIHYFLVGSFAETGGEGANAASPSATIIRLVRPRGRDALVDAVELIREGEGKPVVRGDLTWVAKGEREEEDDDVCEWRFHPAAEPTPPSEGFWIRRVWPRRLLSKDKAGEKCAGGADVDEEELGVESLFALDADRNIVLLARGLGKLTSAAPVEECWYASPQDGPARVPKWYVPPPARAPEAVPETPQPPHIIRPPPGPPPPVAQPSSAVAAVTPPAVTATSTTTTSQRETIASSQPPSQPIILTPPPPPATAPSEEPKAGEEISPARRKIEEIRRRREAEAAEEERRRQQRQPSAVAQPPIILPPPSDPSQKEIEGAADDLPPRPPAATTVPAPPPGNPPKRKVVMLTRSEEDDPEEVLRRVVGLREQSGAGPVPPELERKNKTVSLVMEERRRSSDAMLRNLPTEAERHETQAYFVLGGVRCTVEEATLIKRFLALQEAWLSADWGGRLVTFKLTGPKTGGRLEIYQEPNFELLHSLPLATLRLSEARGLLALESDELDEPLVFSCNRAHVFRATLGEFVKLATEAKGRV